MKIDIGNIYAAITKAAGEEEFLALFENKTVKIQRIVSHSYKSPKDFWYDQSESEWVMVLHGAATLEV